MSSINIKNLKEIVQKRIKDLTDNSSVTDLENLMKIAMLSGGGHLEVDSDGLLPSSGRVAFDKQYDRIFINKSPSGADWEELKDDGTYTAASPGVVPFSIQGSSFMYAAGGSPSPSTINNSIEKISFTSDGNGADVGDLDIDIKQSFSGKSLTHGYSFGGRNSSNIALDTSRKYAFASDGNASAVPTMSTLEVVYAGSNEPVSPSDGTYMYGHAGKTPATPVDTNAIQKANTTTDASFTDVGDLLSAKDLISGTSSGTHGYSSGGRPYQNIIQKWPFANDENASDVGDMLYNMGNGATSSSETHGYEAGGYAPGQGFSGSVNIIQKWPFSADTNATDVGDLGAIQRSNIGNSSTTHGYSSGGLTPVTPSTQIEKYSFTSDGNATDVGDMNVWRNGHSTSEI